MIHIIHISVDGLAPRFITDEFKNLKKMRDEGMWTHNAKSDSTSTWTLPNHTCMFTGHTVEEHGIKINDDSGTNLTSSSIFKVLSNKDIKTKLYVGKEKFKLICRSYNVQDCANIDTIVKLINKNGKREFYGITLTNFNASRVMNNEEITPMIRRIIEDYYCAASLDDIPIYSFIHFAGTDFMGHNYGWGSPQYIDALKGVDEDIGILLTMAEKCRNKNISGEYKYALKCQSPSIQQDDTKCTNLDIIVVLTSDHGGGGGGEFFHNDYTNPLNNTIPFYIWKNDGSLRNNNSLENMINKGVVIRNGDVANFVTNALKLGDVPGSSMKALSDLKI